jgi:hypothetical protein
MRKFKLIGKKPHVARDPKDGSLKRYYPGQEFEVKDDVDLVEALPGNFEEIGGGRVATQVQRQPDTIPNLDRRLVPGTAAVSKQPPLPPAELGSQEKDKKEEQAFQAKIKDRKGQGADKLGNEVDDEGVADDYEPIQSELGEDVTKEFQSARENDLAVVRNDDNQFFVVDPTDPDTSLNEENDEDSPLTSRKMVEKFIEEYDGGSSKEEDEDEEEERPAKKSSKKSSKSSKSSSKKSSKKSRR